MGRDHSRPRGGHRDYAELSSGRCSANYPPTRSNRSTPAAALHIIERSAYHGVLAPRARHRPAAVAWADLLRRIFAIDVSRVRLRRAAHLHHTRLDCVIGSSATMRQAVAQATHHCGHRSAFGKRLVDQPLMRNVLADLCVEVEAATAAMPRLYRDAPLNSIWEGSANVMCLDVLRAMGRSPESVEAFFGELALARGGDARLDAFVATLADELRDFEAIETRARRLVERMALAFQGALLVRSGDPAVADTFCASRLAGDRGLAFGRLPVATDSERIIARARPRVG
jgi:hypothetical protein